MMARGITLAFASLLAGCAHHTETRTNSVGMVNPEPGFYQLIAPEKIVSPDLVKAQGLVTQKLASRGFSASVNGLYYLQVGTAERPSSISITKTGEAKLSTKKTIFKPKCMPKEYRVVIALTKISDGQNIYYSSASEDHCKQSFDDVLPTLVDAALADLGKPRGAVTTKRRLRVRSY